MQLLALLINYTAFVIVNVGLISILKNNFKIRDIAFLIGTILLTFGALLGWLLQPTFEIFSFVLLFALQIIANLLQITSSNERLNTTTLLLISLILFILFSLAGLFQNPLFFLIAFGTVITGIGFKEKPAHILRQSIFFAVGSIGELLFALFTHQNFYVVLNSVSLIFIILIIFKSLRDKP